MNRPYRPQREILAQLLSEIQASPTMCEIAWRIYALCGYRQAAACVRAWRDD